MNSKNKNEKDEIKGIKVRRLTLLLTILESLVLIGMIVCSVISANKYYNIDRLNKNYILMQENVYSFREASDYLTDRSRQYIMTGNVTYAVDYCNEINVTRRRESAVENLRKEISEIGFNSDYYLDEALYASNELAKTEIEAIALVYSVTDSIGEVSEEVTDYDFSDEEAAMDAAQRREKASDLVFNEAYSDRKEEIIDLVDGASDELLLDVRDYVNKCTEDYHTVSIILRVLIGICVAIFVVMIIVLFTLVLIPLNRSIRDIDNDSYIEYGRGYEINYLAQSFNLLQERNVLTKLRLKDSAERDALTGLLNRNGYERVVSYYTENEEPIAYIFLDVDNFKGVNDGSGHGEGDNALRRVAGVLRDSFRDTDYIARYGGDEFCVIMTGAGSQNREVISRKLKHINETLSKGKPRLSVSIGVALSRKGYSDELFKKADEELYKVKKNGKSGFSLSSIS